jgi:transcriptional regulator with XRE-family HTH domain
MLREARTEAGLTQVELARRVGVKQPMIAAYETGAREPSVAQLRRIARALGLQVSLTDRPAPDYPDPDRAARIFLELLDWLDHVPRAHPSSDDLSFPVIGNR